MGKISTLCTVDEVKLLGNIHNNELSDDDITSLITHITNYVFNRWGDPVRKTQTTVTTSFYDYDYTGDDQRVYKLVDVTMGGSSVDSGSYTSSKRYGYITLGSSFVDATAGQTFNVKWVPEDFHLYTMNRASIRALGIMKAFQPGDLMNAQLELLKEDLDEVEKRIQERLLASVVGATTTKLSDTRAADKVIVQDTTGIY